MPYMQRLVLGFCGGALVFGLPWPGDARLPLALALGAALGLGLLLIGGRSRRWAFGVGALVGLGWAGLAHDAALRARLEPDATTDAVTVAVRIESEPTTSTGAAGPGPVVRFQARVLAGGPASTLVGTCVRLTWYAAPTVRRGEIWRLQARIRGPWGFANPGGFDYERWLLGRGIHATGWVRDGVRLAVAAPSLRQRLRKRLADAVSRVDAAHVGIMLALLLGRGDAIADPIWETLRATGTVHLVVISGLHVSLAAALGFATGRLLCRLCPLLPLWVDARRAGCAGGAALAMAYIALAGAGVPGVRALIMGLAVLLLLAGGRRCQPGGLFCLALALVLAWNPLAVHQQGFWLSFAAVALLLLALSRPGPGGRMRAALRTQLVLSVGLLPLLVLLTGTVPWTGLAANMLAVPLMSLLVVPALLLAGVLILVAPAVPWLAQQLLGIVDWLLSLLLAWLDWLAAAPRPLLPASALALLLAQGAVLWWLLGAPRPHWPLLLLCLAAPVTPRATGLPHGHYRVTALDVGQGTAVLVDTRQHRLLYDAGPGYPSGFETGSAVVLPGLGATGPPDLAALVLSHDDVDHVGGAAAVRAALAPARVLRGMIDPDRTDPEGSGEVICHGHSWTWDGVRFRLLDVVRGPRATDNDRSCVLLVDDGRARALLAGDVSSRVEARLLRRIAPLAPLALMFAPHHGSISSSSTALVRVARPRLVFVSAGHGNRFGHPHPTVVGRYRRVGSQLFQTGVDGALIWRSDRPGRVLRWRRDRAPYWRARAPADR